MYLWLVLNGSQKIFNNDLAKQLSSIISSEKLKKPVYSHTCPFWPNKNKKGAEQCLQQQHATQAPSIHSWNIFKMVAEHNHLYSY